MASYSKSGELRIFRFSAEVFATALFDTKLLDCEASCSTLNPVQTCHLNIIRDGLIARLGWIFGVLYLLPWSLKHLRKFASSTASEIQKLADLPFFEKSYRCNLLIRRRFYT